MIVFWGFLNNEQYFYEHKSSGFFGSFSVLKPLVKVQFRRVFSPGETCEFLYLSGKAAVFSALVCVQLCCICAGNVVLSEPDSLDHSWSSFPGLGNHGTSHLKCRVEALHQENWFKS